MNIRDGGNNSWVSTTKRCYKPEKQMHHLWISDNEPDDTQLCQCGMYDWSGKQVNDQPTTDMFYESSVW